MNFASCNIAPSRKGGQKVFQVIQHIYMPRLGVYTLVFRISHLLGTRQERQDALHYIGFWLRSINTHAAAEQHSSGHEGSEMTREQRCAPLVLVGTHLDKIKGEADGGASKLRKANDILVKEFAGKGIECFQANKGEIMLGREHLYNQEQDLCFFPVDNSDPRDPNVAKLRGEIVGAMKNDALDYLNDPIPIVWLDVCDRLACVGADEPLLTVSSPAAAAAEDSLDTTTSVITLMREAGALEGCQGNRQAERERARAMLQFMHKLGVVLYFDDVPGMENKVVLGPQWIIDNITYVIRDFQLHHFRRDENAMKLRDGKDWKDLLTRGIVSGPLLERLWVGKRENHAFLKRLMCKLGVFARLAPAPARGETLATSETAAAATYKELKSGDSASSLKVKDEAAQAERFLCPCTITSVETQTAPEAPDTSAYLGAGVMKRQLFKFGYFLPNGFFDRVVTKLVDERSSASRCPHLWVNGAILYLESDENTESVLALVVDKSVCTIEARVRATNAAAFEHVEEVVREIRRVVYADRLTLELDDLPDDKNSAMTQDEAKLPDVLDSDPSLSEQSGEKETKEGDAHGMDAGGRGQNDVGGDESDDDDDDDDARKERRAGLVHFFQSAGCKNNAEEYADAVLQDDDEHDVESLQILLGCEALDSDPFKCAKISKEDKEEFREQLADFGITQKSHQTKIIRRLEATPPPRELRPYLCFGEEDADHVRKERKKVEKELEIAKLETTWFEMREVSDVQCALMDHNNQILHLAMRGSLGFSESAGGASGTLTAVGPDMVADVIALGCKREDGKERGSIECVVLNSCRSEEIGTLLKERQVPFVVCWKTDANPDAARTFAVSFYRALASGKDKRNYKAAFAHAKHVLKLRQWVVDEEAGGDPSDEESKKRLLAKQKSDENHKLKAAGVPLMIACGDEYAAAKLGEGDTERTKSRSRITEDEITVLELIGEGQFGAVCKGSYRPDQWNGKFTFDVAIKKCLDRKCDAVAQAALRRENMIAQKMDHAFVARAYGCADMADGFMIILELCELGDLETYLRDRKKKDDLLSASTALQLATQLACGISYVHRMYMVHRDIAARNCLVAVDKKWGLTVKLNDFGMTRNLANKSSAYYRLGAAEARNDGSVDIPIQHSPPEYFEKQASSQAGGESGYKATRKGDIWAMGIVFWEIIAMGLEPYKGKDSLPGSTNLQHFHEIPGYIANGSRLHVTNDSTVCRASLRVVIQACWKQNPSERPTADEAIAALARDPLFHARSDWSTTGELLDYLELDCGVSLLPGSREADGFFDDHTIAMLMDDAKDKKLQENICAYHKDEDYDFDKIFPGGPDGEACAAFTSSMEILSKFHHAVNWDAQVPTPSTNKAKNAARRPSLGRDGSMCKTDTPPLASELEQANFRIMEAVGSRGQEEQKGDAAGGNGAESIGLAAEVAKAIESERQVKRAAIDLARENQPAAADGGVAEEGKDIAAADDPNVMPDPHSLMLARSSTAPS